MPYPIENNAKMFLLVFKWEKRLLQIEVYKTKHNKNKNK